MRKINLFAGVLTTLLISGFLFSLQRKQSSNQPTTARFSAEYRNGSKGKVHYEIPEVYELANILILLSGYNENNHQTNFKNSKYAQEVFTYFKPYLNHICIKEFSKKVRTINNNYAVRDSSYAYKFDDHSKIVPTGVYENIIPYERDLLPKIIPNLQSFALDSHFRAFFQSHRYHYERIKKVSTALSKVNETWKWLEARYPQRVDSYRIICSPLTGGNHRTNEGIALGFHEILMFVSAPQDKKTFFEIDQFRSIRTVLTEIDHNYVNPTTNKLEDTYPNLMSPQTNWAKGFSGRAYNTSKMVFNEYMTYGLFSLFITDQFPNQKIDFAIQDCEQAMMQRDFFRFPEFNQELLRFYRANQKSSGERLQEHMMKWSAEER